MPDPDPANASADAEMSYNNDSQETVLLYTELQASRCQSTRYERDQFPRCTACIRKQAGDACRFQDIRTFLKNARGKLVGFSFPYKRRRLEEMQFPTEWNVPLRPEHVRQTKMAVAKALLPTLRRELEHLNLDDVVRRPRESQFRATCDTCMTSLFSSSWMCRMCGRESCMECFAKVKELTQQRSRGVQKHSNPNFLLCSLRNLHTAEDFSPMSRFDKEELEGAIKEMEGLLLDEQSSHMNSNGTHPPPQINGLPGRDEGPTGEDVPSHATRHFTCAELSDDVFQHIWARGEPFVVTGLLSRFKIEWTPDFFINNYGSESCIIVECQTNAIKDVTVGYFFSLFGKPQAKGQCWKLKDWPPSMDFKTAFPDLYRDFSNAVPVPNFVRRDGALNISSHFPTNTVVPDLGPKMYNALRSDDSTGSQGTTRLHMDMADAVNIMVHAEPMADGQPGCAAWDLFRAEDSDKIRQFLWQRFYLRPTDGAASASADNNGDAVAVPAWNDPIHAQTFYLDSALRKELFEKMEVKSHRVYQKPGEAVFIPAGCAHQVCNLSDCVKVASDFVSTHNITRCEKLTKEFRELNQTKVWKDDVLQLKTMMWFAWLSCSNYRVGQDDDAKMEEEEKEES